MLPNRTRTGTAAALAAALTLLGCGRGQHADAAPPVVVGLADPTLDAPARGTVLRAELGCANCHRAEAPTGDLDARIGPDLTAVGARLHRGWILRFLIDPPGTAPGTTMPDVLAGLDAGARAAAASALTEFLVAGAAVPSPVPTDPAAEGRGRALFHSIGCVACHAPRDAAGQEAPLPESVPLGDLRRKYHFSGLRDFLLAPRAIRPSARMPDLRLQPGEASDLAHFLLAGDDTVGADASARDAARVADGRELFVTRGCAACHRHDGARGAAAEPAASLVGIDAARGCLDPASAAPPRYALTAAQRSDVLASLRAPDAPSPERRIHLWLASRNCLACHTRGEAGGPARQRRRYFGSRDEALGDSGRIPPTLTGVGAKLQPDWLEDVIAHGEPARPYVKTRMPAFDDAIARALTDLFAGVDVPPAAAPAPLPRPREEREAVLDLGRALVGEGGMECIACHEFAGERVGTMGAVDLVDTTARRLRPEWFVAFLQAPTRFQPGTLMPIFFPDGTSSRPEFADGDVGRQVAAIWHYLAEGRNVRKPAGMRHLPIELKVGDEAVILRRSVQHTGKRGIAVGYPGGVNLTFDAESLAIDQLWWGAFLDAAPVWTGQGSGLARILGRDRVGLPRGPALLALAEPTAPWPGASRRELGHRFLGYDLDAAQRPTFRYTCDGVTVSDAAEEVRGAAEARPRLRRVLRFAGARDRALVLRAARDARIEDQGQGVVHVGDALAITVRPADLRIVADGDQRELRVIAAPATAELVLEYSWREAPR